MIPSARKHASAFNIALARRKIGLADHHNKDPIVTQAIPHLVGFDLVQWALFVFGLAFRFAARKLVSIGVSFE
jgi:hypothetical protein